MADLYGYPTFYNPREGYAQSDQAMLSAAQTPVVAPSVATPPRSQNLSSLEGFIDWPTYLSRRPDVDPADAYKDYVTVVAPNQLVAMGATPEQIKQTLDAFQQRLPVPVRGPASTYAKDEGVIGNVASAVGHELGSLGRMFGAGKDVFMKDAESLAKRTKAEIKAAEDVGAPQAKFREGLNTGGTFGEYLRSIGMSATDSLQGAEGAFDSAVQLAVGFLPYIASGAIGAGVGAIFRSPTIGGAVAMGLTDTALKAGSKGIEHLQRAAVNEGIDLNDEVAVAKWIKGGGVEKVFGPAATAGEVSGATTALTMLVAGKVGGMVAKALADSKARGIATKATHAGIAATGFSGAGALGDVAIGDPIDEKSVFSNALLMLTTGMLGRGPKPRIAAKVEPKTEAKAETKVASEEAIRKMLLEEEPAAVKKADVVPPAERATPEQIEAIKPFDEIPVEDKAVAVAVVQDVAKEALNEHVAEVTKQVETEVQARKAKRQVAAAKRAENKLKREAAEVAAADIATATPDTTGIVTAERGARPAEDAALQQNVVGEVATGPADRGHTGVIEESVYAATGRQPRGDQQGGRISGSGEAVVGKQVVPGVDVGGKEPVINAFRTKEEAIKAGNPLYAGREATEAANRKAQREIDDALRSEREGDFIPTWSIDTSSPGGVRLRPGFPQAVETVLRAERVTGEQMMGWFARRSDNAGYRTLAQVMLPSLKKPVTIRLMDNLRGADGKSKRGYADSAKREIVLDRKYGLDQETLFHELTHIMTVDGVMNPKTLSQRSAAAEMNKLYEEARAKTRPENFTNAFLNIREFLAESHANKGFQDHLVTIRDKFGKNLWDKFKEIWNRFWGRPVDDNMLEQVLRVSKDLYGEGKGEQRRVDFAENDQQNLIAFKAMEKDGPGDVVGRKGGVITYRGWDNGDGTYRVYEVKPGGDPRGETPKQVVEAENLKDFFTNAGAEIEIRNLKGFDRPPGNESDLITRWQDGRLIYGAVQMPNGTWRAKVGDDIQTRTAEYKYKTYDTKAEAEAAGNEISTFESKEKSEAAQANSQLRNLVEANTGDSNIVTVGDPNMVAHVLFDRNAAINYVGGATDNWLKKRNINVQEGMKLSVEYMLRNSDVGYQTQEMMKTQGEPLLHKTRQMMKSSPLLEGKDGPAMLDNIVRYLVVRERQSKLLPKYTEEAKWNDPADHSKGRTKFYERALQKQQKADDFLNDINTKDPTLAPQVLKHLIEDWKPFSDATIDLEYTTGRITKATADAKKAAYLIYAPLREQGKATGKTATGQSEGGSNLLQQVIEQRVDAILKGVDNKAMNLLDTWMGLLDYRNEDGTKIFLKEPVDREHLKHDPVTREITVTSVINPNKSVVWYKDGVPIRLEVNNDKMLKALDRFHGEDRNVAIKKALATAGFYTRTFSTLHTSLSLPFAPRNFVRDYLVNNVNLDPRISYLTFNKAMFFNPAVWEAAFRHGFKDAISITGADPFAGNSAGAVLARRVNEDRPLIEHKYQYGADLITTEASTALRPSIGSRIAEYLAPSNGKLMNFISGFTHSLEAVNRIAVNVAAIESGIGRREAAVLAKRATTNFEQRGSAAPYLNTLFSFSGAKMSGARTLVENLGMTKIQGPEAGGFKKGAMGLVGGKIPESANPRTVHLAQFAIALGLVGAYMSYKLSEKDKDGRTIYGKRSEYQLDNYLRIPGLNIDIPLPQELGMFYVLGSSMGDALWGDRAGKAAGPAMRFTTSVINNFNPGGTSMHDPVGTKGETGDYFFRLAMPTPITPLYDISRNIDSFGTPVNSQRDSKTIPPEMQGAATASPFANAMAQGLHKTGIMDTSPKAVDHVIKSLFGQQKGTYNAILDGNVGALVNEVFKSFHQDVFKGTNKNDFEAISNKVIMDATRTKGNKLKKGEGGPMVKNFEDAERQIDKLKRDWNKTSDLEAKKRIDEKQDDVRQNALRRYYEATGVTQP